MRARPRWHPAKPEQPLAGLGWNLGTFLPCLLLIAFGFLLNACAHGLTRLMPFVARLMGTLPRPR